MISKSNKFIKYASIAAIAIVALAASLSSSNINLGKNILRGRASEEINGTINFVNTGSNVTVKSNEYFFLSSSTQTGQTVYLRNHCTDSSYQSGYVATLSNGSEITFSSDNSTANPIHFGFQKVNSIYARCTSGNKTLEVNTSQDGVTYTWLSYFYIDTSGATFSFGSAGAKYVKISYSSFLPAIIDQFSLSYTCSTIEPEPTKTLESIEVSNAPSKTEYTEGDYFDPTGLVITASYDDGSEEDIAYSDSPDDFAFSPSLSITLSSEDTSITISFGGKSTSQLISVSKASTQFISGTFSFGTSTKWQFVFNEDLTGEYKKLGSTGSLLATETFSYTLTDSHIRIYDVVISGSSTWTTDWFLTKCLDTTDKYKARETENDTGTYNITTITINTWNTTTATSTLRTFTKVV